MARKLFCAEVKLLSLIIGWTNIALVTLGFNSALWNLVGQHDNEAKLIAGLVMACCIVPFVSAILLIRGVKTKSPKLIFAWLVSTVTFTYFSLVFIILFIVMVEEMKLLLSLGFILMASIQAFSVWVVSLHLKELEETPIEPVSPAADYSIR